MQTIQVTLTQHIIKVSIPVIFLAYMHIINNHNVTVINIILAICQLMQVASQLQVLARLYITCITLMA